MACIRPCRKRSANLLPGPSRFANTGGETAERADADEVLGYVRASPEAIADVAALPPDKRCRSHAQSSRQWKLVPCPGNGGPVSRFSFEVRVRPIVRSRRSGRRRCGDTRWISPHGTPSELTEDSGEPSFKGTGLSRLACRTARGLRRTTSSRHASLPFAGRGYDADQSSTRCVVRGTSRVRTSSFEATSRCSMAVQFGTGLVRGVGRHTAFGFGCLLLAAPSAMR